MSDKANSGEAAGLNPVNVHCPAFEFTGEAIRLANRPDSLEGLTLGLLVNRKRNADALLEEVGSMLKRDYGVNSVVSLTKASSSRLAQRELFEELFNDCDVMISGVGDCGSSASFSICDALELERRGMPAAALVTEALGSNAQATAEVRGAPEFVFATVPHPIASLLPSEVRAIAEAVTPKIAWILLGKPGRSKGNPPGSGFPEPAKSLGPT
ncbi:MAG: hypothetical protein OXI87_09010 [Albidovulum sp.]|nr:hypothetical protein [Albidovulum sp.]MDE0305008.1 hypothetical protein [Albidovulum sp.]